MILFHHIAGAQLLAAPAHSATAAHLTALHRDTALRASKLCTAAQRTAALRVASPCIATHHHALRRTISRRLATQHNATQFQKEPCPSLSPIQIPMARSDAALGHSAAALPRHAAQHASALLRAPLHNASQRNE